MAKKNRSQRSAGTGGTGGTTSKAATTTGGSVRGAVAATNSSVKLTAAADSVRQVLDEAASQSRERAAARLEALGPTGSALVTERGVPLWCVRLHHRVGHLGGSVIFAVTAALAWSLGISFVATLTRIIGVEVVTMFPTWVLEQVNAPVETVVSSTDRFLFTWVMPTLFFVLVAAGLALMAVMGLVRWGRRWSVRLALGLFAGYGTSIRQDRIDRAQRDAAVRAERKQIRTDRRAERVRAREQVRAAKDRDEQL